MTLTAIALDGLRPGIFERYDTWCHVPLLDVTDLDVGLRFGAPRLHARNP